MLRLRRSRGGLGHVPILCIWARACLAWAVAGKDGIMAGGTSSTAITGASGRLICVTCRSNPGSSLSSGSHSGSFPAAYHKSGTKLVARPKRKDNNSQNILSGWLPLPLPLNKANCTMCDLFQKFCERDFVDAEIYFHYSHT